MRASGRADAAAANGGDADAGAGRNDGQRSNYPIGARPAARHSGAAQSGFAILRFPFRFTGAAAGGSRGRRPDDRHRQKQR